jgi:two-component system, OmpR family, sensor histidine kinase KdpD
MASGLHAPWFAVNVETPATRRLGVEDRARVSQNLRLAEQLGAETVTVTGERIAAEILRFARERNVTKIVVGKPRSVRLRDWFGTSFADKLLLGSGDIDVYATTGESETLEPATRVAPRPKKHDVASYLAAAATAGLATVAAYLLFGRRDLADVVMTYLLGIIVVSMRIGARASLVGAILSVLALDFFFIPPYLTFAVSDLRHIVTFAVMMLVAVVVTGLTQRVRDQADAARRSEQRTSVLYAMSRELSRTEGLSAIVQVGARHVEQVFESQVAIVVPTETGEPPIKLTTEGFIAPTDDGRRAAKEVGPRSSSPSPWRASLRRPTDSPSSPNEAPEAPHRDDRPDRAHRGG